MTCMEVDEVKKTMFQAVWTICLAAAALAVSYRLCSDGTGCDYLKLWLIAGIPFGIRRMFLWIIPKRLDLGGTVGVIALNFLVGGLIGGVIMICQVGAALFVLTRGIVISIMGLCRRNIVR